MSAPAQAAIPLSLEERLKTKCSHLQVVDFNDLTDTAGTTKTLTVFTGKAGQTLGRVVGKIKTNFDGGSTTDLTVTATLNYGSSTDKIVIPATSIHEDGTEVAHFPVQIADVDDGTVDTTYGQDEADVITSLRTKLNAVLGALPKAINEAWTLDLLFTATGANLSTLTAGKVQIFFDVLDYSDFDQV
jgi:hypothetical protein